MKQFKLNITNEVNDFKELEVEIKNLLQEKSNFVIRLMRSENKTPETTLIEIDVEYPLIGHLLLKLTRENSNLTFDVTDSESSFIMNRVIILKE